MLQDLIAGNVDCGFDGLGSSAQHIKAGRIKALMVAGAKRNPAFPDVPCAAEVGLPDYTVTTWYGLWAPKGTPADTVARITDDMRKAMPPAQHPVVRVPEGTSLKTLYLGAHATHIVGWPKADGEHFINELNAHIQKPEFRYVHKWKVGDLLVWDNRCTQHYALNDYFPAPRKMERAAIVGDIPY